MSNSKKALLALCFLVFTLLVIILTVLVTLLVINNSISSNQTQESTQQDDVDNSGADAPQNNDTEEVVDNVQLSTFTFDTYNISFQYDEEYFGKAQANVLPLANEGKDIVKVTFANFPKLELGVNFSGFGYGGGPDAFGLYSSELTTGDGLDFSYQIVGTRFTADDKVSFYIIGSVKEVEDLNIQFAINSEDQLDRNFDFQELGQQIDSVIGSFLYDYNL